MSKNHSILSMVNSLAVFSIIIHHLKFISRNFIEMLLFIFKKVNKQENNKEWMNDDGIVISVFIPIEKQLS